jgi:hypothetical protein
MKVTAGARGFHFHIDQTAQADAQRRKAFGVELRVGDQRDIGLEPGCILPNELADGRAADLFFAFNEELEIHRKFAGMHRVQRLGSLDVHVHLPLVVRRAAGVDVPVVDGGLEGRRAPKLQRIGRLDIVMAIAQHCRLTLRVEPVAINERITRGGDDVDILHAGTAQTFGHEMRGAGDVRLVFGKRADTGDAEELLQLFEEAVLVLLDKNIGWAVHGARVGPLSQTGGDGPNCRTVTQCAVLGAFCRYVTTDHVSLNRRLLPGSL